MNTLYEEQSFKVTFGESGSFMIMIYDLMVHKNESETGSVMQLFVTP